MLEEVGALGMIRLAQKAAQGGDILRRDGVPQIGRRPEKADLLVPERDRLGREDIRRLTFRPIRWRGIENVSRP